MFYGCQTNNGITKATQRTFYVLMLTIGSLGNVQLHCPRHPSAAINSPQ